MRSRGTVLIAVLVAVTLGTMVVASLMFRMHSEVLASAAATGSEQAYVTVMSGVRKAIALLGQPTSRLNMDVWYDDEERFRNQFVCDDGSDRWYYTIYAYNPSEPTEIRYGLMDESGKINVNMADETTLMALPNMTRELVHCLLDYRDSDDEPRGEGAEQEYYDRLAHPYRVKNAPFVTVDELLLVKGFDASILYGNDANRNGLLEAAEDDGDENFPPDDGNGQLNRGLASAAVAITYEPNVDNAGQPRLNINQAAPQQIVQSGLPDETAEFVRIFRGEGNPFIHASQLLNMRYTLKKPQQYRAGGPPASLRPGDEIESGVDASNLGVVMDKLTTAPASPQSLMMGLVNVNTAPREVLAAVAGIDRDLADRIVETRGDLSADTKSTVAWLYAQDVVDEAAFKALAPRVTARGYQFRIRCVGFGWPSGRFRVIEAVVDLAAGTPRLTYLRDITRLGLPLAIDMDEGSTN